MSFFRFAIILGAACTAALPGFYPSPSTAQTTLAPELLRAPKAGGPRRWETLKDGLQLRADPSDDATILKTLPKGAVLSNMGCSIAIQQVWCSVRPFRGGKRGFLRADHLHPANGPDGVTPLGADDSKRRARKRDFDAQGEVPCAQERGEEMGTCGAAVARGDGGDATVVVTFPNGFARQLFFVHGEFVSASATMSGAGRDTDWQREEDRHLVRVDDQRYVLPHAFVFGD